MEPNPSEQPSRPASAQAPAPRIAAALALLVLTVLTGIYFYVTQTKKAGRSPANVGQTGTLLSSAATHKVEVSYILLRRLNGNGLSFIPVLNGVKREGPVIELTWPANAADPPPKADAVLTFERKTTLGGSELVVPARGLVPHDRTFRLDDNALKTFAANLLYQLGNLNLITPDSPPTQLTSKHIGLKPPTGSEQDVSSSGTVVISLVASQDVPQISPQEQPVTINTTKSPATIEATNETSAVTLDWLGSALRSRQAWKSS